MSDPASSLRLPSHPPGRGFAGTWCYRAEPDLVECDPELAAALGLPARATLRDFLAIVAADERDDLAAPLHAASRSGGRFDRRFQLAGSAQPGQWARLCGDSRPRGRGGWILQGVIVDLPEQNERMERWRESEQRFRAAFDQTPQTAVQGYDRHRRVIYWNAASEHVYGYTREEALGRLLEELIIPEPARAVVIQAHDDWLERGIPIPPDELELLRKDGSLVPVFSSHVMLRNGWGEQEMYCIDVDLRPQRQALRDGSQHERQLRLVAQATHAGWWEWDIGSDGLQWSKQAAEVFRVDPHRLPAARADWLAGLSQSDAQALDSALQRAAADGLAFDLELSWPAGDDAHALLLHGERHADDAKLVGTVVDISESKAAAARIDQLVHFDPVTGLPNRVRLRDRLLRALANVQRSGRKVVLACIGLDHFKLVNESYGLVAGDHLLKACAQRIQAAVRAGDAVMRLGGDQFVVLLDEVAREADAEHLAEKLLAEFQRPFALDEHEVFIAASLGLSVYPGDGEDPESLIQHAETALHRAKEMGRAHYQFFRVDMNRRSIERLEMTSRLRHALDDNEFELHVQPKVRLSDGQLIGGEALLRWSAPGLGMIPPDRFIPVAEENGLIEPIGDWVLERACDIARSWLDAGRSDLVLALNLSVRQFRSRDLVDKVAAQLQRSGVPASALELEITESVLLDEDGLTRQLLFALKQLGVSIAIDDFGTGYSSLSYLRRFPVDVLKIDRSFVRDAASDAEAAALVRAILGMAQSLRMQVVAEGVETREQAQFLRAAGCEQGQGWLFGRAMPAEQFHSLLSGGALGLA